jgi:pullulanase/glycogen debranching enzyme
MKVIGRIQLAAYLVISNIGIMAQNYSTEECMQGYQQTYNSVTFLFDEQSYAVAPARVVVTGSFRNWDSNMDDPNWELKKDGQLWSLRVQNDNFDLIPPKSGFKFRVNNGQWLDPPSDAGNVSGGNLVFMPNAILNELKAEVVNEKTIWAKVTGTRPMTKEAYRLTDAQGNELTIAHVLPNTETETLIVPSKALDPKRVYFLEIPSLRLKSHCSYDGWFRTLCSAKELGANIYGNKTIIRVFAPRATGLNVYLYKGKDDSEPYLISEMQQDDQGVWEIAYDQDLHGTYYDLTVHGASDPGNYFFETHPVHITDPYARVSDNTWGKARIWRRNEPATPLKSGIPALEDVIAYEVHVQDFTGQLPLPDELNGTFKGMITRGLKNTKGEKIGFDYLLDLGINTVHLMPVQEYLHFPDDDWKASFKDDPYMIEQKVNEENYQWGYRTSHFFAVESKYRTKGSEPGTERDEFRELVQAFHDAGIAVIIDIVPNHTAEDMDGKGQLFNFNALDKQYYYRTKHFEHIGAYGNEVKTENRPMVQKWLIDQCLSFINEFGVDGFRIDLAGQIDQQTLKALKTAIGEDKILYGEAWIGSNDPDYENNPDWDWYKADAPITFFQDDSRNAYKGPVFELKDKAKDRGWAGGKYDERANVMKGLSARFSDDKTPLSGISYLDIHDNFALADQFGTNDFDGRLSVDQDQYKIAVTLLYTTLGPIVTHGGSEIMRSKGAAPLMEVVKETKAGFKTYMHGKRDTYNHRMANEFIWENVGATPAGSNKNDYKNMLAFWRGMNQFRLSEYGKVFRVSEAVSDDYFQWITPEDESKLGYLVDNKVLVLLNAGTDAFTFEDIQLPVGNWKLIATNQAVNLNGVKDSKTLMKLKGGKSTNVTMKGLELKIWIKE